MANTTTKQKAIAGVQNILQYTLDNPEHLWLALQAAGSGVGGHDGNKGLAMIGDAVMKLVLLDEMHIAGFQRGSIDNMVQTIVSNNNLAQVCNDSGITPYINKNPSQFGRTPPKTRAATIEAVLAAVYLDSDREIAVVRSTMAALGLGAPIPTTTQTPTQTPDESG